MFSGSVQQKWEAGAIRVVTLIVVITNNCASLLLRFMFKKQ